MLRDSKLTHKIFGMTDFRDWLNRVHRQRITANDVADTLGISRATATRKLLEGLDAGDIITLCRNVNVNPVQALVDLGHLEEPEVYAFLDNGQLLVDTATDGQLSLELARRLNPATMASVLDEIEARSNVTSIQSARAATHDGTVTDWDDTIPHAAKDDIDENEERLNRGEDPID